MRALHLAAPLAILAVISFVVADPAEPGRGEHDPATRFVAELRSRLVGESVPCDRLPTLPAAGASCTTFESGSPHDAATAAGLAIAEQGTPLLSGLPSDVPDYLQARFPDFDLPSGLLPGFHRSIWFVDESRIVVAWTDPAPVRPGWLVVIVEPLRGPFPHVIPAARR